MSALSILIQLQWPILLWFMLQMLILTVVFRFVVAAQQWIYWRTWSISTGLVVCAHALALSCFAALTDFVGAGAPPAGGIDAILYSASVFWPVQALFLAVELGLRAIRARHGDSG